MTSGSERPEPPLRTLPQLVRLPHPPAYRCLATLTLLPLRFLPLRLVLLRAPHSPHLYRLLGIRPTSAHRPGIVRQQRVLPVAPRRLGPGSRPTQKKSTRTRVN